MKITIQELSKSFGGRDIFNNFSLEVDSGVRLCVCGPNGTGKSTLLRLLAGVEPADGGRVILPRGCRLGFVEQELSEEALDTPLLTYVLDVLHDWNEFWAEWEEAAQQKDEARLTQLMHRQADSIPLATALMAGLVGTAFVAGAVFAVTAENPMIWLTVLLAIPGFLLWGAAYPICRKEQKRQRKRLLPLIDQKYDEAAETAQKAKKLL